MRRVYYHCSEREEFARDGMWRIPTTSEREAFANAAANLMRDPAVFRDAMIRAIDEWPKSCEANLTATSVNHQAWFGHAGCFLATGSPEEATRLGWHLLTQREQALANAAADEAIAEWHQRYSFGQIPGQMSLEPPDA